LLNNVTSKLVTDNLFGSSFGLSELNTKENIAKKMAEEASSFVSSQEFAHSVPEAVGEPKEEETQEDFVSRSLNFAKELLYKRFGL
jgi:hypothetical protein